MTTKIADTQSMSKATGTVSRYGKGWQYRGRYTNGNQFRKVGFKTKDAANEALTAKLHILNTTGYQPEKLTVHVWLDQWLEIVKEEGRKTTYASHCEVVRNRLKPFLPDIALDELNEDHIRACYRSLVSKGLATETIWGAHRRLKRALKVAVIERKLPRNPTDNVSVPKGKPARKMVVWDFDSLVKFTTHVSGERDGAMWALWVSTGLRRGEICGLMWSKIDFESGFATIDWQRTTDANGKVVEGPVKTESGEREIPIDPGIIAQLKQWKAAQAEVRLASKKWRGGDYAFTTFWGKPYYPGSFGERLTLLCERAGVPRLTPHQLRHTFGTRAAEMGVEVTLLSKMMGHSSPAVTQALYIHPGQDQKMRVAQSLAAKMFG